MKRRTFLQTFLDNPPADLLREFEENSFLKNLSAGEIFATEGDMLNYFPLVSEGLVRVYKIGETGREISLYRIHSGEGCILSASCLLADTPFPALAEAEEDTLAILVSKPAFREWIERFPAWRTYIFSLFSRRLAEILTTVEEVAFRRMDVRIATLLLKKMDEDGPEVHLKHADIARELGTAREVVSRILKDFERAGVLSLSRAAIFISNPLHLQQLVQMH